jgi:gliding motility-associated-like protein
LEWESVNNSLGYILSVGTSSGGTDLVNALDLGNTTNYSFEQPLPEASTIYVTIIPYSINLLAENCREETFTTIEVSTVHIFNRYGQLLKQLFPDQGWDGSFNGKPMASDSYWYRIETSQGNSQIGFFMLKR